MPVELFTLLTGVAGKQRGQPLLVLSGLVAAAGIEEFVTEFLPGLLSQPGIEGLAGSLQLHATDGPSQWWVSLDSKDRAVAVAGHRKADTVIRATGSDLLLWLTNLGPARTAEVAELTVS